MEFLIVLGIIAVVTTIIIVGVAINNHKDKLVLEHSEYIRNIKILNSKYSFKRVRNTCDYKPYYLSSKRAFDTFDSLKRVREYVRNRQTYYRELIDNIYYNQELYEHYKKAFLSLKPSNDEEIAKRCKVSLKSLTKREMQLGSKLFLKPILNYTLYLSWEYTSPAGRNRYSNKKSYSLDKIKEIINSSIIVEEKETTTKTPKRSSILLGDKTYTNDDIEEVE